MLFRLRREFNIPGGIPVLLSTEKPRCQLVSMVDMEGGNPLDYQVGGVLCGGNRANLSWLGLTLPLPQVRAANAAKTAAHAGSTLFL